MRKIGMGTDPKINTEQKYQALAAENAALKAENEKLSDAYNAMLPQLEELNNLRTENGRLNEACTALMTENAALKAEKPEPAADKKK